MKSESNKAEEWSQKRLEIELSKLIGFEKTDVKLEQYQTPGLIAADWLWKAGFKRDLRGKVSADLACGPGILGCGALLLRAKRVYFVDKSAFALDLAKKNVDKLASIYNLGKSEFIQADVADFNVPVDTVLQNPPFGTKIRHHDKRFLEKAFIVGKTVYSMHKIVTAKFVEAMARENGFEITDVWPYDFKLGMSLPWHRKKWHVVKVGVWRMVKGKEK